MNSNAETRELDAVIRALATAARSLRLYPPSSPMPRQSVEAAASALDAFFATGEPVLALTLGRDGFEWRHAPVGGVAAGAAELAQDLRDHGVAEVDFVPGCTAEELLAFLGVVGNEPDALRANGGISAATVAAGVDSVRVTDVQLTVIEHIGPEADQDVDEFLRQLTQDPEKLAAWFAAAAAGDPATFEEGLMELVRVAGPSGFEGLLSSLSGAFLAQEAVGKDALLGLALDQGAVRDLTGGMFRFMGSSDIAGAVLEGNFGKNMLSLSTALTHLPLDQVTASVRAEVQAMLPNTGHTTREAQFLEHMIDVRERSEPEASLVDADTSYRAVIEATRMSDELIGQARSAVMGSGTALSAASVRTMLALLDQQRDFELYATGAESLAAMVPRLLEQGDIALASRVLTELSGRLAVNTGPWPELSERLRHALETATGPRSMAALMRAVTDDAEAIPAAREILRHGGEGGHSALVAEAIQLKEPGIEVAEQLIGRRIVDMLVQLAPQAQWFQLGPIVKRLVQESDPRSTATVEALLARPDEQSRREVVTALAGSAPTEAALASLRRALKDPSAEVVVVAARALGRSGQPAAGRLLAGRISEIDLDGADFVVGREMIAALARCPGDEAAQALDKLAARKALIKRGHFAEVQGLVAEARRLRASGGVAR